MKLIKPSNLQTFKSGNKFSATKATGLAAVAANANNFGGISVIPPPRSVRNIAAYVTAFSCANSWRRVYVLYHARWPILTYLTRSSTTVDMAAAGFDY